jgi:gamma-glutamyltranspeptidase/glutathione hydrolase
MNLATPATFRPTLYGTQYMAVSGHPLASVAAMRILEAGGNAVDAGVAGGFALNVVQCDMANLGGVAPILLYNAANGTVTSIAGVGCWPRAVTLERLKAAGGGRIPTDHRRWVVPAAVDAWCTALARYGTLPLADVLQPALELAAGGFPNNYFIRHNLLEAEAQIRQWQHSREVFFPRNRVPEIGEVIVQKALAQSLGRLVDAERQRGGTRAEGIAAARDRFYKEDIAQRISDFSADIGAFLRLEDLAEYAVKEEPPISVSYRGRRLYTGGPWSQAPALAQSLQILQGFDLPHLSPLDVAHLAVEGLKLAMADRNAFYGDPDFVNVPLAQLTSEAYSARRRAAIDPRRAQPCGNPGPTVGAGNVALGHDTTYVCVVDRHGNAFSATPSDSTMLISPLVPGLGFGVSDRGLQASLDPADPNAVAPGKRPRLTPAPALIVGDDLVMPFGTPGGDVQVQAMLQFLINTLDLGLDLQAAVEAPRWASYAFPETEDPHRSWAGLLRVEGRMDPELIEGLQTRGHVVETWPDLAAQAGGVCAIRRDRASGVLAGAADPRRMSYGIGW